MRDQIVTLPLPQPNSSLPCGGASAPHHCPPHQDHLHCHPPHGGRPVLRRRWRSITTTSNSTTDKGPSDTSGPRRRASHADATAASAHDGAHRTLRRQRGCQRPTRPGHVQICGPATFLTASSVQFEEVNRQWHQQASRASVVVSVPTQPAKPLARTLRRRFIARYPRPDATSSPEEGQASGAPSPPTGAHPLRHLQHLGSAAFNDAPLESFLSLLCLHNKQEACGEEPLPSTHRSLLSHFGAAAAAIVARECCTVHLNDVEGRGFRVYARSHDVSPIRSIIESYEGCLADGTDFVVCPLADDWAPPALRPTVATSGVVNDDRLGVPAESHRNSEGNGDSNAQLLRHSASRPMTAASAEPVVASWDDSFAGRAALDTSVSTIATGVVPPPPFTQAGMAVPGVGKSTAEGMQCPIVERWRRYSTAVALYVALADAGTCDSTSFPFLTVQLTTWRDLLGGCEARCEMLSSGVEETRRLLTSALRSSSTQIPVAVMLPMARKGVLRRPPLSISAGTGASAPSMVTQPFTDGEVFQLYYLQLVFRAFFDIRFPGMTFPSGHGEGSASPRWLRSDLIGVWTCRRQALAFEHPALLRKWLTFPAPSRVLTLLNMEEAIIPMYATAAQLSETAHLPLFGCAGDVPCLGELGHAATRWAAAQEITSPMAAALALHGLFDIFSKGYGCDRERVWTAQVPLKIFRCSEAHAFAALRAGSPSLSRFFVCPEKRRSSWDGSVLHTPKDTPFMGPNTLSRVASTLGASTLHVSALATPRPVALNIRHAVATPLCRYSHLTTEHDGDAALVNISQNITTLSSRSSSKLRLSIHTTVCEAGSGLLPAADTVLGSTNRGVYVAPTSPFTMQESLVTRWRHYAHEGLASIFDGVTDGIELVGFLGRGGSGLVYRGCYGRHRLPVAVKVFVVPDGMPHEKYVHESLTDVSFFVLCNQLDDFGICHTCRAHDFIVSSTPPRGLPLEDADTVRRGGDAATTKLCYLVTDLMDGTIGRFLREDEDDYDPLYDTLLNSPLRDGELFQFLYAQLVSKALFEWRALDVMLSGQLRGDNIGFRHTKHWHSGVTADESAADPSFSATTRPQYDGILVQYQAHADLPARYLRFPADLEAADPQLGSLRFIYFIDLGQGIQPNVAELTRNSFIGDTVVDSCVTDDGFGRYWPLDELYCKYVEVKGALAEEIVSWGSQLRIRTQEDAIDAVGKLFDLYTPMYGIATPTAEDLEAHLVLTWSPGVVSELMKSYVYRVE